MLLIMFAHHPGLMMVQFMVKGSDLSQILSSQVTSGRIRGGGSSMWSASTLARAADVDRCRHLLPRPQEAHHRQDHLLGES
jgi:hypothetical protein